MVDCSASLVHDGPKQDPEPGTPDLAIYRLAAALIDRLGEEAAAYAQDRAERLRIADDLAAAAIWYGIKVAIQDLQERRGSVSTADRPMPEIDLYRAAKLLIDQHGGDAGVRAAERADALLEEGDLDGASIWRAIIKAIEELQRDRRPGEAVN